MMEPRNEEKPVHHHFYTCFWPANRWGFLFCGASLVTIGSVWLLSNLGLILEDWWELVLPALLIGWGALTLLGSRSLP